MRRFAFTFLKLQGPAHFRELVIGQRAIAAGDEDKEKPQRCRSDTNRGPNSWFIFRPALKLFTVQLRSSVTDSHNRKSNLQEIHFTDVDIFVHASCGPMKACQDRKTTRTRHAEHIYDLWLTYCRKRWSPLPVGGASLRVSASFWSTVARSE